MALAIDHHVVGFDVTENDFLLVQVFQSEQNFRAVESDPGFPPTLAELQVVFVGQDPKEVLTR